MTKTKKLIISALVTLFLFASTVLMYLNFSSEPAPAHPFYSNKKLEVIAHRGGRGIMPENTLAAFQKATEIGVDILEMDIHETRDGHLVVIHDAMMP